MRSTSTSVTLSQCVLRTLLAAVLAAAVGCGDSADAGDQATGGSAGEGGGTGGDAGGQVTGGSAGEGGECSCGSLEECWAGKFCVAKQVLVNGGYSIDATEVTRSQYSAWLATDPDPTAGSEYCSWNTFLTPGCDWPPKKGQGSLPVVCVNWCDALAYCQGVGKRLCGKIGGGPNDFGDFSDPAMSQWYRACSSGGVNNYPYGGTPKVGNGYEGYEQNRCCEFSTNVIEEPVPVGSLPGCTSTESGYEGVFDLSGNVWEWEDSCYGSSMSDQCRLRGGAMKQGSAAGDLRCASDHNAKRERIDLDYVGFRCCSK